LLQSSQGQEQGAENIGTLTDEATATFSELFGEGMAGGAEKGGQHTGDHHHSVESMAGVEKQDWDRVPLNLDGLGGVGDWHDRSLLMMILVLVFFYTCITQLLYNRGLF
jgi:hypothetical protein